MKHDELPTKLAEQLLELNESRKTLYHFGHSDADASLARATGSLIEDVGSDQLRQDFRDLHSYAGRNKEVWAYAVGRALEGKALAALEAAMQLRSWLATDWPARNPAPPCLPPVRHLTTPALPPSKAAE